MNNEVQVPLVIYQGATWSRDFYYRDANDNPIDITDYTAKTEGRQTTNSSDPAVLEADTNNYITVNGTLGLIAIQFPAIYTTTLPLLCGGVYDLFIYGPGGEPAIRLVGGPLNIRESVTR